MEGREQQKQIIFILFAELILQIFLVVVVKQNNNMKQLIGKIF